MLPEGYTLRGDRIGKRVNDWYVWTTCPNCAYERWVLRWKTKLPSFTGFCQSCNGKYNKSNWNNGVKTSYGYVYINTPSHTKADTQGYVKRAVLVLEKDLSRPLLPKHDVHHINGIRDDDRAKNLIEVTRSEHMRLHQGTKELKSTVLRQMVEEIETCWHAYDIKGLEELKKQAEDK